MTWLLVISCWLLVVGSCWIKETFYKREKHLPNIRRAQEIVNNGLEVGATLNGMMQNIEENTLDLTELYKKMIILEKENTELKQRLLSVEAAIQQ